MEYPLLHKQRNSTRRKWNFSYYTTPRDWLPLLLPLLWNSGNSLIGLVGALGGRGTWDPADRMLEVSGGWLIAVLARRRWASAITLGDVVLYAGSELVPILHAHERVHVRQGRLWGPAFLPAYVLESAWQWILTGDGYRNNRFEVTAYSETL